MFVATVLLLLWTFAVQDRAQPAGNESFIAAKQLYAQGEYEAALSKLTTATARGGAAEVNQYRALCFLALGRTAEAEKSLEELVTQQPLFKMSEVDVSPRVVTMFHSVRRRLLPEAVRDLYAKARTNYEQKLFEPAAAQFKEVLTLLSDEDLRDEAKGLADLKTIAEGFVELAEVKAAAAEKAQADAAAKKKADAAAEEAKRTAIPPAARIYTEADKDVTPPVAIKQTVPEWRPQTPSAALTGYRGVLRLVINEQGRVDDVSLVQRVLESYDPLLLAAAKDWTFRPARKENVPVKYQKLVGVTLLPSR